MQLTWRSSFAPGLVDRLIGECVNWEASTWRTIPSSNSDMTKPSNASRSITGWERPFRPPDCLGLRINEQILKRLEA